MLILVHACPKSSGSDAFYSFKTLGSFSAKFLVLKSLYLTVNCKERRLGKFVIKLSFMERNFKFWKIVNHSWQATWWVVGRIFASSKLWMISDSTYLWSEVVYFSGYSKKGTNHFLMTSVCWIFIVKRQGKQSLRCIHRKKFYVHWITFCKQLSKRRWHNYIVKCSVIFRCLFCWLFFYDYCCVVRAVFKWLSKVITWLRLLRLMIGLKDSRQFFSQWEAKPKPIVPCTRDFSHALTKFQVIARNCDWLIALSGPVVWLVGVIALVLVFRQSFENRSITHREQWLFKVVNCKKLTHVFYWTRGSFPGGCLQNVPVELKLRRRFTSFSRKERSKIFLLRSHDTCKFFPW